MSDVAIRVEGLGKQYRLGGPRERYSTLRDQIQKWTSLRGLLRRATRAEHRPPFWALKDVSFEVEPGEVVGIIGRNGAGKSTLLKILSRITEPTEGEADIHGRVGSLLEVGTGFHPELTGRENVYLNGAILGMRRAEFARKFDEIVAFAEVEKFIDTPVKHYSSGMYTRLAFAVAAHLDPEILIVDEVLAVGDADFQRKCLGKMGEVARSGRTVLFVSHNMGTVTNLCERAVWLAEGKVKMIGPAQAVVARYASYLSLRADAVLDLADRPRLPGLGGRVRFERLEWLTPPPLVFGCPVRVRFAVWASAPIEKVSIGIGFSHLEGSRFLTYESDSGLAINFLPAEAARVYELTIPEFPVSPGLYSIDLGIRSGDRSVLDGFRRVADIEVIGSENTPSFILQFENFGVRLAGRWVDGSSA